MKCRKLLHITDHHEIVRWSIEPAGLIPSTSSNIDVASAIWLLLANVLIEDLSRFNFVCVYLGSSSLGNWGVKPASCVILDRASWYDELVG